MIANTRRGARCFSFTPKHLRYDPDAHAVTIDGEVQLVEKGHGEDRSGLSGEALEVSVFFGAYERAGNEQTEANRELALV